MGDGRVRYLKGRLLATVFDAPIVLGWVVFAALAGLAGRLSGVVTDTPGGWDIFVFLTLVLPVVITFAFLESSPRQATFGGRMFGLRVVERSRARIGFGRPLVRSAVKFVPWQLAHTAVFHPAAGEASVICASMAIVAQVLVVASAVTMALDRHHLSFHDLAARTLVIEWRTQTDEAA